MSVKMSKELGLEAYNRDRGGAQHEKGDVEIEGLYYGCKRRKVIPRWVLPEKEETGVVKKDVKILSVSKNWLYYDLPKNLIKKVFKGKYKGQKQKWYIMRFYGKNHKINIQTENPEFQKWKWTPSKKLKNIIVSFKKKLYREILKEFECIIR